MQALIDLLSDIERMSPPEILLSLRSLLGNLPADITFPRNVSEVSWLMLTNIKIVHIEPPSLPPLLSNFQLIFNSVSDLIDIVQRSNSDEVSGETIPQSSGCNTATIHTIVDRQG